MVSNSRSKRKSGQPLGGQFCRGSKNFVQLKAPLGREFVGPAPLFSGECLYQLVAFELLEESIECSRPDSDAGNDLNVLNECVAVFRSTGQTDQNEKTSIDLQSDSPSLRSISTPESTGLDENISENCSAKAISDS